MSIIIGHKRQQKYLTHALAARPLRSHAFLFYGPRHVGKYTLAKEIAKMFFCTSSGHSVRLGDQCDACEECMRVRRDLHPEVLIRGRSMHGEEGKAQEITIEEVRKLRHILSFASVGLKWRVVILYDIDRIKKEAGNALLKLLEEPGAQTLFIGIASNLDAVLPTIRSRMQSMFFSFVPESMMKEWLTPLIPDVARRASVLSYASGRPGIAMRMRKESDELTGIMRITVLFGAAFDERTVSKIFDAVNWMQDKDIQKEEVWFQVMRMSADAIKQHIVQNPPMVQNLFFFIRKYHQLDMILTVLTETNTNRRLASDLFLLHAMDVVRHCERPSALKKR